jgi:hypothetical protein
MNIEEVIKSGSARIYYDCDGNEKTLRQMFREEPEWFYSRFEHMQKALEKLQAENKQLREAQEWISVSDRLPEIINKKSVRQPWGSSKSVAVIVDGSAESFEKGYVLRFQDGSIDWRVIGFTNPDVLMWKHLEPPKEQGE